MTNNTNSLDVFMPKLSNSSYSEDEKGRMIIAFRGDKIANSAKIARQDLGDKGVYLYYQYKQLADTDKNGSVKASERNVFLESARMSDGEKEYWGEKLK